MEPVIIGRFWRRSVKTSLIVVAGANWCFCCALDILVVRVTRRLEHVVAGVLAGLPLVGRGVVVAEGDGGALRNYGITLENNTCTEDLPCACWQCSVSLGRIWIPVSWLLAKARHQRGSWRSFSSW